MASPKPWESNPTIKQLDNELAQVRRQIIHEQTNLEAWESFHRGPAGQGLEAVEIRSSRAKLSKLEKLKGKLKIEHHKLAQRLQSSQTPRLDSSAHSGPATRFAFTSHRPASHNSVLGMASPFASRLPKQEVKPERLAINTNGFTSPSPSSHRSSTKQRSTPSSSTPSKIKRDFSSVQTSPVHGSHTHAKRPKPSANPFASSAGASSSAGGTESTVIDLTGNDDQVLASINHHRKMAIEAARGRSMLAEPASVRRGPSTQEHSSRDVQTLGQRSLQHHSQIPSAVPFRPHSTARAASNPSWNDFRPASTIHSSQQRSLAMPGSFPDDAISLVSRSPSHNSQGLHPSTQRQPAPSSMFSSLSAVINRVNTYDFTNMTDMFGNPLDDRVATYARDVMDDPRKTGAEINRLLANITSDMVIPEEEREGTPDGLRYSLYPHQQEALTWMKRVEKSTKGGILADDMGLGKTISMLALILSAPPVPHAQQKVQRNESATLGDAPKFFTKTNLVIAPKALIKQWEDEIKKKVKTTHELSVYVFHGTQRASARHLMKYDVVLTTYATLLYDYTRLLNFWKENEGRNVNTDTDPTLQKDVSFFHPKHAMFHRIVLDESQVIKNDKSKTTNAICELRAYHRWCMSGTPIMNSVEELYPLLRFLRIPPYNSRNMFRQTFSVLFRSQGDPPPDVMRKLQVLIKSIVLRRTKKTMINGKPIVDLPPKTEEVIHVTLGQDEVQFYKDLEGNARVQINKYLREGTLGKHYHHVLVLLLRLRQVCCHPHLIVDSEEAHPDVDSSMLERAKLFSADVVRRIVEKAHLIALKAEGGFECPICYDMMVDPTIPLPCGHEICSSCLQAHAASANRDNIRNGEEGGQVKCPVCRVPITLEKVVTYKAFKKVHMPDLAESDTEAEYSDSDESEDDADQDLLADDANEKGNLRGFIVDDSDKDDSDLDSPGPASQASKANSTTVSRTPRGSKHSKEKKKFIKVKPSMLKTLRKEARKNAEADRRYRRYLSKNWLPSAKITCCLDVLRNIRKETNGEKTIIFSQWTMLLDFLEVALARDVDLQDVGTVRFDGEMSMSQRDRAARQFKEAENTQIMLVSLKAGNAGLNLVAASRVIIMDPFWNPYIEMQAVDRAYRIGQQKPVKVYRILTKETVEDRIIEIQDKKRNMVDAALDEGVAKRMSGLSLQELTRLFNFT